MKNLILLRHSKAENLQDNYNDHDRKLTQKGQNDASKISLFLKQENILPNLIISSTANRALQTSEIFASNLSYDKNKIKKISNLYDHYTSEDFINIIISEAEDAESILVVGHNPCLGNMAYSLLNGFNYSIPTSCTIQIGFEIDNWNELEVRTGKLLLYKTANTIL